MARAIERVFRGFCLLGTLGSASCRNESTLATRPDAGGSHSSVLDDEGSSHGLETSSHGPTSVSSVPTSGQPSATSVGTSSPAETSSHANAVTTDATSRDDTRSAGGDSTVNETTTGDNTGTPGVIEALREYLEIPRADRPELSGEIFASMPLSKAQAEEAKELLWQDHVAHIEATRQAEHQAKAVTLEDKTLKYDFTVFGQAPARGRSLVLSLHGGGEAEASVNDEQWENQKGLYSLDEGIYVAPRAPTNTWNLWHEPHIDPLFERLIENFIVLEGVDPNRVYVMGYSAGGDGVYQLGPRMADHWAAASAMAGHPNEAKPLSLRNIGFTIHVGGDDTAFDRNLVAVQWKDDLDALQSADPQGYDHMVEVHAGKGHWMDLEDAVAVPWMAEFTRDPVPKRVVWYQDDILHQRFYWLKAMEPVKETTVVATLADQTVTLDSEDVSRVAVRLRDDMLNLDEAVTIVANGERVFDGIVPRTLTVLYESLVERGDPTFTFSAQTNVEF